MRKSCIFFPFGLILLASCFSSPPSITQDAGPDISIDGNTKDTSYCAMALADFGPTTNADCLVNKPTNEDLLDEALEKIALDRCNVKYSDQDLAEFSSNIIDDPYRLSFFDRLHKAALNVPPFAEKIAQNFDLAVAKPRPVTDALMAAVHYSGYGGEVCYKPAAISPTNPLATAIIALLQDLGEIPDTSKIRSDAANVPEDLQRALAPIIREMSSAVKSRHLALANATNYGSSLETLYAYAAALTIPPKDGQALPIADTRMQQFLQGGPSVFDYQKLYHAAIKLAASIEGANLSQFIGIDVNLNIQTPIGRIILRGPSNDLYSPNNADIGDSIAFLLDTGGNETYKIPAGATASEENFISILIDLDGEDSYGYEQVPSQYDGNRLTSDIDGRNEGGSPTTGKTNNSFSSIPRQGAGRLGIGMLWDLGTKCDVYTSLRMSQGFGALGVGVLYDEGGEDTYQGESGVQGSGVFGIGLLIDTDGNDIYKTYNQSQGYGYVKGVGILYDKKGSDQYLADIGDPQYGGDPLYFSPQLAGKGNTSAVQGAGVGRRPLDSDEIYMSGGMGVLRDLVGNDRYLASVYGQGTAFWFGTGILADGGGDDIYDGLWYVQGSAAHFGVAAHIDDNGNDLYNSNVEPKGLCVGAAQDFSVCWHVDKGGNDSYKAEAVALGAGSSNGMGFLINKGGIDTYDASGDRTLGGASISEHDVETFRVNVLSIGIFVDTQGDDTYILWDTPQDKNNQSWTCKSVHQVPTKELGIGLDGQGTVELP